MKKIIIVFAAIALAGFAFFGLKSLQFYNKIYTPILNKIVQQEKTAYNILLFGYGGGVHEGAYLTDTMMMLHVDMKTKKAVLFSIPRDLWVKLPTKSGDDFHIKINAVYQLELGDIGDVSKLYPDLDQSHFGAQNDAEFTKYIISQVFSAPIDNYVAVDFAGFTKAIDVLGGVDINVLKAFTDPQYPVDGREKDSCGHDTQYKLIESYINNPSADQDKLKQLFKDNSGLEDYFKQITDNLKNNTPEIIFPCRYETLHFDKGMQHMDGTTALKYVRSRHALLDGGDFGRSARQQQLLKAAKDKVLNIGFIPKIIPLLDELGSDVKTDFSPGEIQKFLGMANNTKDYQLTTYVISDQNLLDDSWSKDGQFILIPKQGIDQWSVLQAAVKNIFIGIIPTPIPTATPSGTLQK